MNLSRGARRLLDLLKSFARRSGRAFPFQKTLAEKLEVKIRTIKRWVRELREGGLIAVRRRQHSSAEYEIQKGQEYEIQKGQNVPSDVPSGVENVPSGHPVSLLTEVKSFSGGECARVPRKPPGLAPGEAYWTNNGWRFA